MGFPGGSEVKASARSAGDLGSIPGLGRSPGEGNGNPLQYSCLENPMDGGAWWATVHGVAKSLTRLSDSTFTFTTVVQGFPGGSVVKNPPAVHETCRRCRFDPWVEKIPWRRKWQVVPVLLPGHPHGQRSLAGYSPWGHEESDRTE